MVFSQMYKRLPQVFPPSVGSTARSSLQNCSTGLKHCPEFKGHVCNTEWVAHYHCIGLPIHWLTVGSKQRPGRGIQDELNVFVGYLSFFILSALKYAFTPGYVLLSISPFVRVACLEIYSETLMPSLNLGYPDKDTDAETEMVFLNYYL